MTGGPAATLSRAVDVALDRTVAPGFTALGLGVRRRLPGWPADPRPGVLAGRHVAVTGASGGLGRRTVLDLAALGATVHLVVRDMAKGERVASEVRAAGSEARVWRCDVADLDAVRAFADAFVADGTPLRALVHNAGALPPTRTESPQGHELTQALHVLGPVLMTERLLPALAPEAGRVVLVTSGGMYTQRLAAHDPEYVRGEYSGSVAYARSKRGQVELLPTLAERWAPHGVTVHATHPGWARTAGLDASLPTFSRALRPVLRSDAAGADTTVWVVATEPTPPGGRLWHDRRPRPTHVLGRTRPRPVDVEDHLRWVLGATGLDG
ncbi:SDR family NAD(P)-dependent oxidoreductase [Phycicoccus sp. BSK3Z-2]|uniref:SDR family NAD(P)-dependent oxidoreductase n=1 Tax=Phycicoccus avicenniae TaxID=2828860 RepID=A0A941DBT6_9MICO|nr:SDR family NAD(P)-dependent oxidoreductase [Phycicoccus avicenniae]MBR7744555.1 SDR family NAD(P)-dependent oxidoreductase [Phycicoccus avicenniae]